MTIHGQTLQHSHVFVFTSIKAWRRPGPQSRDPRVGDRVAGSGRFKGDGVLLRTLVAGLV